MCVLTEASTFACLSAAEQEYGGGGGDGGGGSGSRVKKARAAAAAGGGSPVDADPSQALEGGDDDHDGSPAPAPLPPPGFLSPSVKEYLELGKSIPGKNIKQTPFSFNPSTELRSECSTIPRRGKKKVSTL